MPAADASSSENMSNETLGCFSGNERTDNKRESEGGNESSHERKRRRKSRWASDDCEKTFIPGMPTVIPTNLSKEQEDAYVLQLQIEEATRKLRTGDLGIAANPEERSPSPEPIYSFDGKRMNTREYRTRKKLEEERHQLIGRMIKINPEFKPPSDYKPPLTRVSDKVMIPQDIHPDINFVGLLIGPRGNTLKAMEHETGAKIIIRGKGSVKEGKVGRKDGQPLPGENEPLHAYVTANNTEYVKKAVEKIKDIIRQGVEVPEGQNDLRRQQLRELALLNGTLRENDGIRCTNCGASDHKSWTCPDKPNVTMQVICTICGGAGHIAKDCRQNKSGMTFSENPFNAERNKIDEEYMSLMAELGEGPPPPQRDDSQNTSSSDKFKSSSSGGSLFDRASVPRAILPPQIHLPTPPQLIPNSLPPPMWATQSNKMPNPSFNLPPPLPSQTNPPMLSQPSISSNVPPQMPPPSWPSNVMPPSFPFCAPTNSQGGNNMMIPPHWMTALGIPTNAAGTTTAIATAPQNTTTTTSIPVPSTLTSGGTGGTHQSGIINVPTMQPNSSISAWQQHMPPAWQPPFPFPTAPMPPTPPPASASNTIAGNIASATSQLSSFLVVPPPPPPPPPLPRSQ